MKLWIKTHPVVKLLFPNYLWSIPNVEKKVWLTFDDGPVPEITEWVLDTLQQYNAKATFFCIGDNIRKNPNIYKRIIDARHATGNHTYHHLKGWKTPTASYIENAALCAAEMNKLQTAHCTLFRPPYGKIKRAQAKLLRRLGYKIVMWDVLSADFDPSITPQQCLHNVLSNVTSGSIIVFHDSIKAFPNLKYALPKTLEFLSENGYRCEVLD